MGGEGAPGWVVREHLGGWRGSTWVGGEGAPGWVVREHLGGW